MADGSEYPGANTEGNTEPSLEPDINIPPPPFDPKKNLRPAWKKGQSGNPKGRPKRGVLTDALALIAGKKAPEEILAKLPTSLTKVVGKRPTLAQLLMFRLVTAAVAGDVGAMRLLFDRLEGKAPLLVQDEGGAGQLEELMDVLALGGVPAGEVNE